VYTYILQITTHAAHAGRSQWILLIVLLLMVQSFALKCSKGEADLAKWQSTLSVHVLALEKASSNIVGSNSCSAMFNHETALYDASYKGFAGLHIAAFETTAWISDTRAACRVSAGVFHGQSMMVLSKTSLLATYFNAVLATQNDVSCDIIQPESTTGNCRIESEILTTAWVQKNSTKCVAEKAEVPQMLKRCTKGKAAWGSRRAKVTVRIQRETSKQCLSATMQGVSMDIMEAHQYTDSRFQASTTPSPWFLVLAAIFCLQWQGNLSRVVRRSGLLARFYDGQRPLSIARSFHALPIVLTLVVAALILLPVVHAASAALIAATAALGAANIAHTALLSSIQVEATATAAATLVLTHIHKYVYIYS